MRVLALAIILILGTAAAAAAQTQQRQCAPYVEAIRNLNNNYQETERARGINPQGKWVMQIFASEAGSWTILVVDRTGVACVAAEGRGFEAIAPKVRKQSL